MAPVILAVLRIDLARIAGYFDATDFASPIVPLGRDCLIVRHAENATAIVRIATASRSIVPPIGSDKR